MESPSSSVHREFSIQFTKPLQSGTAFATHAVRLNEFRFIGKGTLSLGDSDVVLAGKRSRPFWFSSNQVVSIPLTTIVNACAGITKGTDLFCRTTPNERMTHKERIAIVDDYGEHIAAIYVEPDAVGLEGADMSLLRCRASVFRLSPHTHTHTQSGSG